MIYFSLTISPNELLALHSIVPEQATCFIQVNRGSEQHFGVMEDGHLQLFIDSLSPEPKKSFRLVDEKEILGFVDGTGHPAAPEIKITGNTLLLNH
jgi:hypothetical protein